MIVADVYMICIALSKDDATSAYVRVFISTSSIALDNDTSALSFMTRVCMGIRIINI